jgi:hypothetical protein
VEILAIGSSQQNFSNPETIDNISQINGDISADILQKIESLQNQKIMEWQLYLENFKDHQDFINKLSKRSYKGMPSTLTPMLYGTMNEFKNLKYKQPKVMLQKKIN